MFIRSGGGDYLPPAHGAPCESFAPRGKCLRGLARVIYARVQINVHSQMARKQWARSPVLRADAKNNIRENNTT